MSVDTSSPEPLELELRVIVYLTLVWILEKVMVRVRGSPLLGKLLAGVIFGPSLLDLVPYTDAFVLLGTLGVMILVIDSGLELDLDTIRSVRMRGIAVAAVGVIAPVLLALLLGTQILGYSLRVRNYRSL